MANSRHPVVLAARRLHRGLGTLHLPMPHPLLRGYRAAYLVVHGAWCFLYRVLVCEPLFRAACTRVGRGLRTDASVHFVQGPGEILIGDDVIVSGKCSFQFASRFSDKPTLSIGDRTMIGHASSFVVAREISVGSDCLIASYVHFLDSNGHPVDPARRLARQPPLAEDIKPVRVGNNVWIGSGATILPGVTIGDGSVVAAHSVVATSVAPYTLVAGYPARKVRELTPVPGSAPPDDLSGR